MKKISWLPRLILSLAIGAIAVAMLIPIVLTITNSLMTEEEIGRNYDLLGKMVDAAAGGKDAFVNLKILPDWLSFKQYAQVLVLSPKFLSMFWNSAALVVPIVAGQTVVASLAAYAFAKLRFFGRDKLFLVYLMTMLMPFQVTLVPNYLVIDKLGLMNHASAIILPGIFGAFGVFMMRQFMLAYSLRVLGSRQDRRGRAMDDIRSHHAAAGQAGIGGIDRSLVRRLLEYDRAAAYLPAGCGETAVVALFGADQSIGAGHRLRRFRAVYGPDGASVPLRGVLLRRRHSTIGHQRITQE